MPRSAQIESDQIQQHLRQNSEIVPGPLPTPCWIWKRGKDKDGYGQCCRLGECKAHRVSYRVFKGPIEKGICVCHECDISACVNPEHLWLGSRTANNLDMVAKGRQTKLAGERHGMARLSEAQIREMHHLYLEGFPQRIIAERFGITSSYAGSILRGDFWKHLSL